MVPKIFVLTFFIISFMVPIVIRVLKIDRMSIFNRKSSSDRTCSINIRSSQLSDTILWSPNNPLHFKGTNLNGKTGWYD